MIKEIFILTMLILTILLPIMYFYFGEKKKARLKKSIILNIISFFGMLLFASIFVFTGKATAATEVVAQSNGMAFIGAAISVGLGSIGAGFATGQAASSALGALSENDTIMGKALIFVALAEGIAIYGLIIAFMILNQA